MFCQRLRKFVFASALLVMVPFMARAEDALQLTTHKTGGVSSHASSDCGGAAPAAPAADCGTPAMTTVKVQEWVQVQKPVTKTVYKNVTKEIMVTEHKWETVQETKTKQVTEYKKVTETVMEPRTTTVKVPVTEMVTVNETRTRWETVTEMKTRTVDKGHWETYEVPAGPSILDRLHSMKPSFGGGLFAKHGKGDACADPCADPCASACSTSCAPACEPVRMKTCKKWVSCPVTECYPVCKKVCVKECVPVTKCVTTYKCETKTEMVAVCKTKCVPECKTVTYTECKKVCVPVQVKKCVTECVPVQETCMVTVCEPRWVEKQVPAPSCNTGCSTGCNDACADPCASHEGGMGLFSKLRGKLSGFGSKLGSMGHSSCGCH